MLPLLLFLILSFASIAWTLHRKFRRQMLLPRGDRKYTDLPTLGLPAVATIVNAVLVYRLTVTGLSVTEHIIQMVACCCIIPPLYMHFARQMGKPMSNTGTVVLWLLCLPALLPEVVIYNPFSDYEPLRFTPKPFALYVVAHGEKLWAIYTGDLMAILQALVAVLPAVPLARELRENSLRLSRPVYAFFAWWVMTAIYIIVVSSFDMTQLTTAAGTWFYYLGMSFSIVSLNILFALDFDRHPVETAQGEVVENVDIYLDRVYANLASQMEAVMTEEQVYRQPGYTVEDMCERLHTNRKQLSQMMMQQYGIHFPEYLNNHRLEYAQQLLLTTQMKMVQVAEESGFAGSSHMNRLFKQRFDCTPSQWVKEHKDSQ